MIEAITRDVQVFSGAEQEDDLTLVVARALSGPLERDSPTAAGCSAP